jgi:hypothetical protein
MGRLPFLSSANIIRAFGGCLSSKKWPFQSYLMLDSHVLSGSWDIFQLFQRRSGNHYFKSQCVS